MDLLLICEEDFIKIFPVRQIAGITIEKVQDSYFVTIKDVEGVKTGTALESVSDVEALISVLLVADSQHSGAYIIKDGKLSIFKGVLEEWRDE